MFYEQSETNRVERKDEEATGVTDAMRGVGEVTLPDFSSPILQHPFVRELIIEGESMLIEINYLREVQRMYALECQQHVHTTETAMRHSLANLEMKMRLEICTAWQACLLCGLHDAVEEVNVLREDNATLQNIMLTVQTELGAQETGSPFSSSDSLLRPIPDQMSSDEVTPVRVITAADLGSKLKPNYTDRLVGGISDVSLSPRTSFGPRKKRVRVSDDGWLPSPSDADGGSEQTI